MQQDKTPVPKADGNDPAVGGVRSASGSTYGDFSPRPAPHAGNDPSRGAELERDVQPPNADYGQRPEFAGSTAAPPERPAEAANNEPAAQVGSHPLGAVFGVVIGALLGALIGFAAGPVGSLAGAVMGAVAGLVVSAGLGKRGSRRT